MSNIIDRKLDKEEMDMVKFTQHIHKQPLWIFESMNKARFETVMNEILKRSKFTP